MALRNFWAKMTVDGYKTVHRGGPRSKTGGMSIVVYQRHQGEKEEAVKVNCIERDGKLFTNVYVGGELVGKYETER